MELYIHFGIYKTGSSYLQYICANQRAELEQKGIYFPTSPEDNKMRQGLVSKGNAWHLEYWLWTADVKATVRLMEKWRLDAESISADRVLISAEALVHQIAIEHSLATLLESAQQAGFKVVHALGFFRPLVDHALSTYKHRAKSGDNKDLQDWIENIYETPVLLQRLLNRLKEQPNIHFTLRSFRKDSEWMMQAFFLDWLKIELPNFKAEVRVNASLSLSEIKFLEGLKSVYPLTLDILVRKLQAIPSEDKANDKALEAYTKTILYERLKQCQELLDQLTTYFEGNEGIELSLPITNTSSTTLELNPKQWEAIQEWLDFSRSMEGRKIRIRRRILRLFPILRYLIFSSREKSVTLQEIYPSGRKTATNE